MPHVDVWVEACDVLQEVSDSELEREVARRLKKRAEQSGEPAPHIWTSTGLAEDMRSAFYSRDANRFEALLCRLDGGNLPVRARAMADA
jgi:hypothetical protein